MNENDDFYKRASTVLGIAEDTLRTQDSLAVLLTKNGAPKLTLEFYWTYAPICIDAENDCYCVNLSAYDPATRMGRKIKVPLHRLLKPSVVENESGDRLGFIGSLKFREAVVERVLEIKNGYRIEIQNGIVTSFVVRNGNSEERLV